MLFTFRLANIACKSVLSTEDSDWGAEDGIRVFCLITTEHGTGELLVSGREFPVPDAVDNFLFHPGKSLDLAHFPPAGASDWESTPVNISQGESVLITVIGINEGLPYVAGGGGHSTANKAAYSAIEEFYKKVGEKVLEKGGEAAGAAGGPILAAAFVLLEALVDKLNEIGENCQGVAFAYQAEYGLAYLLAEHLKKKTVRRALTPQTATSALHIAFAGSRPHGCGSPTYELDLDVVRHHPIALYVEDPEPTPWQGQLRLHEAQFKHCAPEAEMYVWTEHFDRTITVRPSVPHYTLFHPTWHVDAVPIPATPGAWTPVHLTKEVRLAEDDRAQTRSLQVQCQVETVGDTQVLRVKTNSTDGNYVLRVGLHYRLADGANWTPFHEEDVIVVGQRLAGNQAYADYLDCAEKFWKKVTGYRNQRYNLGVLDGLAGRFAQGPVLESHLNSIESAIQRRPQ